MTIRWHCIAFDSFPPLILYDVLRLRSEVFVVEQNCVFQDIDRQDLDAYHLLGYSEGGELVAYARLFPAGKSYEEASIGRVIVAQPYRSFGLGRELMRQALLHSDALFGPQPNKIGAQQHLEAFYNGFGYEQCGPMYVEDGIPHIPMRRA
ncbi:GNAT family N-acetyltransferase [Hymenobacter sp. 5317J-9]|uniref:GNAT family N-acetyltransferase n=1 Tax=Hymenobacter sp. 5317J-9 TaxID=2932250 RepID=UPI001FD6D3F8|nr:GNAT family N-acetyltransferase [Hymenobacter sp. 5317J-9]UOQ97665.1 GNAT family N-acetyltransferase [Hymenobacter sp. 5317J-9]